MISTIVTVLRGRRVLELSWVRGTALIWSSAIWRQSFAQELITLTENNIWICTHNPLFEDAFSGRLWESDKERITFEDLIFFLRIPANLKGRNNYLSCCRSHRFSQSRENLQLDSLETAVVQIQEMDVCCHLFKPPMFASLNSTQNVGSCVGPFLSEIFFSPPFCLFFLLISDSEDILYLVHIFSY